MSRSGFSDRLCRVQRAATREDGEGSEDTLLLLREELVAPGDRRPERLLPCLGVPAAFQQVEAIGEALQYLRGRERLRAGGSELDREREVVEASAELGDLVRGVRAGSARRRDRPPRTRRAEAPGTRLPLGLAAALGSSQEREVGAALHEPDSSGAASITCSRLSRRRSISRSPMCPASPSCAPSVCAIVSVTSEDSRSAASPTQNTPALYAGTSSAAASRARRVFPEPPGPVSVSRRAPHGARAQHLPALARDR